MKKLLTVAILFMVNLSLKAQIPNPSFECWDTTHLPQYEEPCSWTSYNLFSNQGYPVFVYKSADSHNGNSAIEVRTVGYTNPFPPYNPLVDVGLAQTGTNYQNGPNGFQYTQRPTLFSAWVKYMPQGVDSAEVKMKLYKWNNSTHQPQDVAHAEFYVKTTDSVYHCKMATFIYVSPFTTSGNPDTASVYISSSFPNNPTAGSIIRVDDISFTNCTVGINDLTNDNVPLHFYPNPAADLISFSSLPVSADRVKLFEITGKMVAVEAVSGSNLKMDIKILNPGIYFYGVYDENNKVVASGKFSVVR